MTLDIAPLTGTLGAEVRGVDLARVDDTIRDELRKAWLDHKVLVFGGQRIGVDEHIAFAQRFGTVDARPVDDGSGTPQELTVIHTDGESGFVASEWHGDVTSDQHPALGAVLRARIVPPIGGDTCWADTATAYDRLSADWKAVSPISRQSIRPSACATPSCGLTPRQGRRLSTPTDTSAIASTV